MFVACQENVPRYIWFAKLTLRVTFAFLIFMNQPTIWCSLITGVQAGTVIAMALGGWLCNTTFLGGWPAVFYVFGVLGVFWGVPWFLLAHDLPEDHPRISPAELEYIQTHRYYVKREKVNFKFVYLEITFLFFLCVHRPKVGCSG